MSNPLRTPEDYELFLYTLLDRFPSVQRSSVTLVRRGATLGRVAGELHFAHGILSWPKTISDPGYVLLPILW